MSWLDSFLWPREALSNLQADMAAVRLAVLGIPTRFVKLERLIMTSASDLLARLDAASNEIASDLSDLRDRLTAAVADKDAAVQAAVAEALSGFEAPIARLEALGADEADPVPAPVEPAPVEPAPVEEPPADEPA